MPNKFPTFSETIPECRPNVFSASTLYFSNAERASPRLGIFNKSDYSIVSTSVEYFTLGTEEL